MFDSFKIAFAAKIEESREQLAGSLPELLALWRAIRSPFSPKLRRALKAARASDDGRAYGWFIEKNQTRIGELDYVQWDIDSQFWYEYRIRGLPDIILPTDPDEWIRQDLTLRNRRFTDVVVSVFLTSFRTFPTDGIIRIRFAKVPIERFEKEEALEHHTASPPSS